MFDIVKNDPKSRARSGRLQTPHGVVETPAYVIVATHGEVRCLEPEDLTKTKTQIVIANTYHLWRSLRDEGLNGYLGLHEAMQWQGPIMTDSGGFQVISLGFLREAGMRRGAKKNEKRETRNEDANTGMLQRGLVRITESGVYFKENENDDEESYLDAELSIKIQEQLGADIVVAFDEPTAPTADHDYTRAAMARTHAWARRSLETKEAKQLFYGVVQGGAFKDLRTQSATFIGNLPFDGIAIGSTYGSAYGGTKAQTREILEWTIPALPKAKPRHLFGVGRIEDIFAGVEQGIDTFDCVIPTREARHGSLWTAEGRFDVTRGKFGTDASLVEETCACPTCAEEEISRQELHELFKSKNERAGRLATIHNVYFFNNLMEKISEAITNGRFADFKKEYLKKISAWRAESANE